MENKCINLHYLTYTTWMLQAKAKGGRGDNKTLA